MSKRLQWKRNIPLSLVLLLLFFGAMSFVSWKTTETTLDTCQDALTAADARYALSESTTALIYDQWRADNLGDAHGVEYAKSGIQQNTKEIDAVQAEYQTAKEQCQ